MAFFAAPAAGDSPLEAAGPSSPKEVFRQVATLIFAATATPTGVGPMAHPLACWNALTRLGFDAPLYVVYDLQRLLGGLTPAADSDLMRVPGRSTWDRRTSELFLRYAALLRAVAATPVFESMARRPLPLGFEAVVLARIIRDVSRKWMGPGPRLAAAAQVSLNPLEVPATPWELALTHDPSWSLGFMSHAVSMRHMVVARGEQIDLGPLRLLGLFAGSARADLLDLFNLMGSSLGGRAVEFSLQLLPSLLETKRSTASQRFSIDGYASVERRGSLDAILPSELAHDEDTFAHKVLSDELLYYGHERRLDSVLREHWVLVDTSASMRGLREIFARGLAVALCKKLALQGDGVTFRFFDSRLHRRIPAGSAGGHELPHILSFRSERGRHYARVFDDLLGEARRAKRRGGRELAITFITHGECHIPPAIIEGLAATARLYGIFVLPSRPMSLPYVPLLHKHHVVNQADFADVATRKGRALHILQDIARAHP